MGRVYQYSALDDCTRSASCGSTATSATLGLRSTLAELQRRLPFLIRKIRTDHGPEFPLAFVLAVEQAGSRDRYIRTYNLERFSLALGGETPAEKLARLRPAPSWRDQFR